MPGALAHRAAALATASVLVVATTGCGAGNEPAPGDRSDATRPATSSPAEDPDPAGGPGPGEGRRPGYGAAPETTGPGEPGPGEPVPPTSRGDQQQPEGGGDPGVGEPDAPVIGGGDPGGARADPGGARSDAGRGGVGGGVDTAS